MCTLTGWAWAGAQACSWACSWTFYFDVLRYTNVRATWALFTCISDVCGSSATLQLCACRGVGWGVLCCRQILHPTSDSHLVLLLKVRIYFFLLSINRRYYITNKLPLPADLVPDIRWKLAQPMIICTTSTLTWHDHNSKYPIFLLWLKECSSRSDKVSYTVLVFLCSFD